ncbi:MAG: hypothetical protein Q8O41_00940 [Candidatus Methanoperedens sp.]|nr:hypothetical protein [Candidatus Methanoperedens sp.]
MLSESGAHPEIIGGANEDINRAQKELEGSVRKVYRTLRRCEVGKLSVKGTDCSGLKLMPLMGEQKSIMELFDCSYLVRSDHLISIGVTGL